MEIGLKHTVAIDVIIQRSGSVNKPDVLGVITNFTSKRTCWDECMHVPCMDSGSCRLWSSQNIGCVMYVLCSGVKLHTQLSYGLALKVMKAGKLAKSMSEDCFKRRVSASSIIVEQCPADISRDCKQLLAEEVEVWQFWFPHTYLRVGTRLVFPDDQDNGVCYCRLLLGDTMLNDDSFRTGTSDSPIWLVYSVRQRISFCSQRLDQSWIIMYMKCVFLTTRNITWS